MANMMDGPISLSIFWPKTPGQLARHDQGHCHDARCKYQAKVQVFPDEQPHVIFPLFPNNNVGSLLDLVQETQSEQCSCDQEKRALSSLGLVTCVPFLVSVMLMFSIACFGVSFPDRTESTMIHHP
jgi:hypothetical protein